MVSARRRTHRSSPPSTSAAPIRSTASAAPATMIGCRSSAAARTSRATCQTAVGLSGSLGTALGATGEPAADVDRLEEPDQHEAHDHRAAAVGDERERDAGDRRDPDRHADVDEDLDREDEDDARRDDRLEEPRRERDDLDPAPDDQRVEEDQDR